MLPSILLPQRSHFVRSRSAVSLALLISSAVWIACSATSRLISAIGLRSRAILRAAIRAFTPMKHRPSTDMVDFQNEPDFRIKL